MKKALSMALAFVMCLAMLPLTASALNDGTFDYTISDAGVAITALTDKSIENLVIPDTIAGKPVISIAGIAKDSSTLKSVVVPGSVKTIKATCFYKYHGNNISSVTLSEGLEVIEHGAFMGTHITSIVIPESVKTIDYQAFRGCGELTRVKLPSTLESLPKECFYECGNLAEINIPDTLTDIGDGALSSTAITSIKIPAGTKELNSLCVGCKNLREVELPYGLEVIGGRSFGRCPELKSILIPTTVKRIGLDAFNGSGLEELIIPYGVETFYGAEHGCDHLSAVYVPSTVSNTADLCNNTIAYCMPGSKAKEKYESRNFSCLTDTSVDTRINVLYNGRRVSFGSYGQDPEIVNSRTMVPLRSIFEAMGADIQWDGATRTVTATRGASKIVMTVGQTGYTVNGASKTMDTPPMILNDRTMVPVRVVAESFGANVTWHAASATVLINE